MADTVVGRGLAFPLHLTDQSRLALVSDDANIRRSIRIIIFTVPGERVMRPSFGCEIHSLVFHPCNDQTAALAERYVTEALNLWESRIDLVGVNVTFGDTEAGEMIVSIEYKIRYRHEVNSMVLPYYIRPVEA